MPHFATTLSPCRDYRYTLWRKWSATNWRYLMVVGLNPSTADENKDDPTIRKCIQFAKNEGFGGLLMANLFAFRATDPQVMKERVDPVGPENDKYLLKCANGAGKILAAWGTHGSHRGRADKVCNMLQSLWCLGTNQDGSPKHPLYLPYDSQWLVYHQV